MAGNLDVKSDRWRRVEALYHEMLVLPAHERDQALLVACPSDPDLAAEVRSLLDQPESESGFLATPAFDIAARFVSPAGSSFIGRRLGVFEVKGLLGVGGMGEVYRAHDTRLGRDVAIKVLPESFAHHDEQLARFTREAQTLASLNHPNIAAIFGVEEVPATEGSAQGSLALVMELVDGEDLSAHIARGPLPIRDVLPIARQIADALEAAHEQGIIHRDLKPANIKVRRDGTVKVLDFGLAKAVVSLGAVAAIQSPGRSPTLTEQGLQAGMIMGTAAYMSPEQAKGDAVDRRADIWSFGVVLYEMLSGKRAFAGDDVSETLKSVRDDTLPLDALPSTTPPRLKRLIARCLNRDLRTRLRDIGEARVKIARIEAGGTDSGDAIPLVAASSAARAWPRSTRWALGLAVVSMSALAVPALRYLRGTLQPPPPETRLEINTPATDQPESFALSPDGRQIAFVASGDGVSRLWVRSLATTTATPLADTEGASYPFWSPDSRSIGFFVDRILKRIDPGSGPPLTIATRIGGRGGAWNADGVILVPSSVSGPLVRIPASGGPTVAVTRLDGQTSHRFPSFLPDGRHFLFYATGTPDVAGIYLGSLDSPETHRLTPADAAGIYLASGSLLWVQAGKLVSQRLDLSLQRLTGEPVTLDDPVVVDSNFNVAALSASVGGLVAYRPGGPSRRQLTWLDRSGKTLGTLGGADENILLVPSVAPDGRRVLVARTVRGNEDIWLLEGARSSRVTFDAGLDRMAIWSPDSRRIVFHSNRKGPFDLYEGSVSRAGEETLLLSSPQDKLPNDWSPDGRFLLYHTIDPQMGRDLWVLPMQGDPSPWAFLSTPFNELHGQFSPDGTLVAYQSNESGRQEIYIRPFIPPIAPGAAGSVPSATARSETASHFQVSIEGGIFPRWRPDGQEIYYIAPNGAMMAAAIARQGSTVTPGAPVALFRARIYGGGLDRGFERQYDVARDGRFLVNAVLDDPAPPITVLMNWSPAAKR